MHTSHRSIPLALLLWAVSEMASAESLYVADKLVLNVYSEANQGGSRIATIETGDAVEELERVENSVHVRLADGREGWVGANYLSTQPPAIVRLKQLQNLQPEAASSKQSLDEMTRLQKQNTALNAELVELKKKAAVAAVAAAPVIEEKAMPAAKHVVESDEPVPVASSVVVQRDVWWAWAVAVIAAAAGGFVAGYQTLGRRVRERFGGVKVY
jgi:SH3 domain protein